jgi:hypothetical protein
MGIIPENQKIRIGKPFSPQRTQRKPTSKSFHVFKEKKTVFDFLALLSLCVPCGEMI